MGQVLAMMRSLSPLLGALALLALGACSSDPQTRRLIASATPFSRPAPVLAPEFAAAERAGTPRFIAAVEARPEAIALFVRQTRSERSGVGTWISGDGAQLMLDDGLLVGSRGFSGDVMAAQLRESAALIHGLSPGVATRLMTLIDGEDHAVTRAFRCQISPGAREDVTIGTRALQAVTVTEACRGTVASFENYYWVVPQTGEIIQSSQWAGTVTGKISLRMAQLGAR